MKKTPSVRARSVSQTSTRTTTQTSTRVYTHVAAWVSATAGTIGLTSSAFALGFIKVPAMNDELLFLKEDVPVAASAKESAPQPNCKIFVEHVAPTQEAYRDGVFLEAGTSRSYALDTYRVKVLGGDARLEAVGVGTRFDSASFDQVAVGVDGIMRGTSILPSGVGQNTTVALTGAVIPQDTAVDLTLHASLAPIVSSAAVGGATVGVARTGAGVQLGLLDGFTSGSWDAAYAGRFNIQATCLPNNIPVYAEGPSMPQSGPLFFARRATISAEALMTGSTALATGIQKDLIRVRVAPRTTSASLKKLSFHLSRVASARSTWSLSNFTLRRGSVPLPVGDYRLLDEYGRDLRATSSTPNFVAVVFTNEEAIAGGGSTYALAADISGRLTSGDSLTTRLVYDGGHVNATGYLTTEAARSADIPTFPGPHLDESVTADDTAESYAFLLWSDQSEAPHVAQPGTEGGSRDWILGGGIAVYRDSQTLTR